MTALTLQRATGNARVDATLRALVGAFETAFPGCVRSYFVDGSYADHTGLPTSDVDVTVVLASGLPEGTRARAATLARCCAALSAVDLDLEVADSADFAAGLPPMLKFGSELLYGEDFRDRTPVVPIDIWTRDRMHTSYWRIASLFGRPRFVAPPLDFPDPAGEFYGYDRRTIRLPDGSEANSTRDLLRLTGWAATALVALKAGRYVARKRDCHIVYREAIGDAWSGYLDELYEHCRRRWQYRLPAEPAERALLRALCRRTLDFERHFLAIYQDYVRAQLRAPEPGARIEALRALGYAPLLDGPVQATLRALRAAAPPDLAAAIDATLRRSAEAAAARRGDDAS